MTRSGYACSTVAAACILAVTTQPGRGQASTDKTEIQGKWVLVSLHIEGRPIPQGGPSMQLSFVGNQCVFGTTQGSYLRRDHRQPKEIDLTFPGKDGQPYTLAGIYERKGDTLHLALPGKNWNRPRDLSPTLGDGQRLYRFQQIRAEESVAKNPKNREVAGELTRWRPLSQLMRPAVRPPVASSVTIQGPGIGTADQQYNLQQVNKYRAMVGSPPLELNAVLNDYATAGSQQLMKDHTPHNHFKNNPLNDYSGETQGYWNGNPLDPRGVRGQIDDILAQMMAEPFPPPANPNGTPGSNHHSIIIDPVYRYLGVGLVVDPSNNTLYFTNDFTRNPPSGSGAAARPKGLKTIIRGR